MDPQQESIIDEVPTQQEAYSGLKEYLDSLPKEEYEALKARALMSMAQNVPPKDKMRMKRQQMSNQRMTKGGRATYKTKVDNKKNELKIKQIDDQISKLKEQKDEEGKNVDEINKLLSMKKEILVNNQTSSK